jgi:hypothetical protein
MMYMVDPIDFAPSQLISSSAVDPCAPWAAGSYNKHDRVMHAFRGLPREWESLVNTNTQEPGTGSNWADIGPSNRTAMFDNKNSTQTTGASPLQVVIAPGRVFTNLALFNITANSVLVESLDLSGQVLYSRSVDLLKRPTASWSEYYFKGFGGRLTQALFKGLPFSPTARIRITLTGPSTVGIGRCVVGQRQDLGMLHRGAAPYFTDYSYQKWDPDFGDYEWTVRDFSRGFRGRLTVPNESLNSVWSALIRARAKPTLYVGTDLPQYSETLVTLGVMEDIPASLDYQDHSLLNFTVKGLT